MKKLLCPTDFSDTANAAIAYAAKLAKATGSLLTLLHVKSVFDYSLAEVTKGKHISAIQVTDQLDAQSREVSKTFKVSCDALVVSKVDKLSRVIAEVADDYDLIVMGTNGIDDLYQFFNGSNTYNAIANTNTPLLLVPEGFTYCEIRNMVYAYDYLRERHLPIEHLAPFVKAVKCRLTVLQVMEEARSQEAEDDLRELQFIFKTYRSEGIDCEFDTIRSANIPESINSYILRTQPDALALCSVHRNLIGSMFHKSTIKTISAYANYPVYVFHQ